MTTISAANPLQLAAKRKFTNMNFLRANQLIKQSFIFLLEIASTIPRRKAEFSLPAEASAQAGLEMVASRNESGL